MINTTIYHQLESEGKSKTFRNRPGLPHRPGPPHPIKYTCQLTNDSINMRLHMITSRKLLGTPIRHMRTYAFH